MKRRLLRCLAAGLALFIAFAFAGCSGGNSTAEDAGGGEEQARIAAVQVTDNGSTATMTVNFELSDEGVPLAGVDGGDIRFTVAKLMTASSPSSWQSYINRTETKEAGDPGTTPDGTTAFQATAERASTDGGIFTDNGDGTYSYTFSFNFRTVTDPVAVTYDPALTHRVAMQVSDNVTNASYDFVPVNPAAAPATRSIVSNANCSECHQRLGLHGGDRVSVDYCVTCHNPGTADANSGNTVDFTVMVHKIHDAADYTIWGFNNSEHDYSDVLYPQDILDCRKCHNGDDPATPDGDDWKTVPSEAACSSCHPAPDNVLSFTPDQIEAAHLTSNSTPNNPFLPPGVPNIVYVLNSATVDGNNQAVITFQILRDGEPINLLELPADLAAPGRWPGFILAYALSQEATDGIATPAEYNNLGLSAAQPVSVSLGDLSPLASDLTDFAGTLAANSDGTFTATTGGTEFPTGVFPPGAFRRAVGLQGYFQVDVDGETYSLHTPSAVIAVSGDEARREVVDSNKCASCHEWFEGHGGNRVFNMNICTFCHVPNLSSSGRTIAAPDPDLTDPPPDGAGLSANALTYPEATNNFKDMVHGIHGGEVRTTDYEFVRGGRQGYYNFSDVVFPQSAGNCLACHIDNDSFTPPLDEDTLLTTNRTTGVADGDDASTAAVQDARDTVPNDTDFVITPTAAACYACHTAEAIQAHMEGNGALINVNRSVALGLNSVETCAVCHGSGKSADVVAAHRVVEPTVLGVITAPPEEDGGDSGGGGQTQVDLCGPGPISAQPAGHTTRLDCCSCHGFN
jgi:hypothetical protein